jgi:hypothetical protein
VMFSSRDELLEVLRDVALEEECKELLQMEPADALLLMRKILGSDDSELEGMGRMKVSEMDAQTLNRIDLLADKALPMPAIASTLGVPVELVEAYLYGSEEEGG